MGGDGAVSERAEWVVLLLLGLAALGLGVVSWWYDRGPRSRLPESVSTSQLSGDRCARALLAVDGTHALLIAVLGLLERGALHLDSPAGVDAPAQLTQRAAWSHQRTAALRDVLTDEDTAQATRLRAGHGEAGLPLEQVVLDWIRDRPATAPDGAQLPDPTRAPFDQALTWVDPEGWRRPAGSFRLTQAVLAAGWAAVGVMLYLAITRFASSALLAASLALVPTVLVMVQTFPINPTIPQARRLIGAPDRTRRAIGRSPAERTVRRWLRHGTPFWDHPVDLDQLALRGPEQLWCDRPGLARALHPLCPPHRLLPLTSSRGAGEDTLDGDGD